MPKESLSLELPKNGTNGHQNGDSAGEIVVPDEVATTEIAARERAVIGDGHKGWTPGFRSQNKPEKALKFTRRYTKAGADPFETSEWEKRTAAITGETGKSVFEQKDCEIPKGWSQLATNVW